MAATAQGAELLVYTTGRGGLWERCAEMRAAHWPAELQLAEITPPTHASANTYHMYRSTLTRSSLLECRERNNNKNTGLTYNNAGHEAHAKQVQHK